MNLQNVFDSSQRIHALPVPYMLHAPVICMFLDQIMCGTERECIDMVRLYGGDETFGKELYQASHYIIRNTQYDANARQQNETEPRPQITCD